MPTASISIRDVTPDDITAIAGLLTQLNRAEGNLHPADAQALMRALFTPSHEVNLRALVACREEIIAGVLLYYRGYDVLTATYGYHLADIAIDETLRRAGIGTQLIAHLAAQNLREGGEWVSLTVLSENRAAKAFYASLGMIHVPVDFYAAGKTVMHAAATLLQK